MDDSETFVSNTTGEKYEANNVSAKIPPFWEEKPEILFFQVEAQFSIANITQDQTKFNYLIAQLEPKVVENIWNIIQSERNDKYVAEKESTFKESEEKKARQLDGNKLKLAKQEFTFILEKDIIRPSKSPWASPCPLHLVSKEDGSLRPCGDYRRSNAQTIPDRYPIPRIEDFHHIFKQKKIFSKIDLFKAYFQIPIAEEGKKRNSDNNAIWVIRV
ncbi:hypothetical protein AVEN_228757-1 [Araneus ventricosus]|uniref:Transposon Ty3-I Gag-Pol polyprotein n=1 Tax=Araneus ventricosus TaxID=182803 RepID=A0A4Y2GPF4_ARAVE|nr:hypothetical protein AVEN_228757-1 [Araneus ventricosus]